jgi:hypothetical protein
MHHGSVDLSLITNYFSYKVHIKVSTDYILTRLERQHYHI